jgi:tRNA nucleotidyltransferase (CCA-adding enzyme)
MSELLARLLPPVAALLGDLGAAVGRAGSRLWLVGGAVRDLWLGEPSADIDLVVEGAFEAAAAAIAASGHGVDAKDAAFLTYRVRPRADLGAEGLTIDLGATRRESYPRPAALPVVEAGTFEEDLRRRDVSLNAVGIRLDPEGRGEVADPTGGLADLAAGRLRVLHARSFEDDPTRAFRVARFAGRYGFALEETTAASLAAAVTGGLVDRLSPARVRAQLALLAAETPLEAPVARHEALGVLAAVHPALAGGAARAAPLDAAAAGLRALGVPTGEPLGRFLLACLAGRTGAEVDGALARVGIGGGPGRRLAGEAGRLPALAARLGGPAAIAPRALHEALAGADPAAVVAAVALGGPAAGREVSRFALDLQALRPRLDGRALAALGVPPGPAVGRVLDRLLTERLEGRLTAREDEVAFVRRLVAGGSLH